MRRRVILVAALATVLVGGLLVVSSASGAFRTKPPGPAPWTDQGYTRAAPEPLNAAPPESPPLPLPPRLITQPVSVKIDGFFSWALLDRKTDKISGSRNLRSTSSIESMIKIWIVSDFLRRTAARGDQPTETRLEQASAAIRDSDDNAAQILYEVGGRNSVVRRMISTCDLTETEIYSGWWSRTQISARDAVRLGECVADGRAAGKKWTSWVLREMRNVRGSADRDDQRATSGGGRWGIIDGLPAELRKDLAIKNGWTPVSADGNWHVNCLAVSKDWVLGVLMRYPVSRGLKHGVNVCKSVAQQLVARPSVPQR
jgi:hypothetical protein